MLIVLRLREKNDSNHHPYTRLYRRASVKVLSVFGADAMNKFCGSVLCVEKKVRERYVLIGRRVVAVPGVDADRRRPGPRCSLVFRAPGLEDAVRTDGPAAQLALGTC